MTRILKAKYLMVVLALAMLLSACGNLESGVNEPTAVGDTSGPSATDELTEEARVTICHATGSETNPYEEIEVNQNALQGHEQHEGDLIPAPAGGCPTEVEGPSDTPVPPTPACTPGDNTILAWLEDDRRFDEFVIALADAGVATLLDSDGTYTIFAPLDNAWDLLNVDDLNAWRNNDPLWDSLVTFHIVEQVLFGDDLDDTDTVTAMNGETLSVSAATGEIVLNGTAEVSEADNEACNGVVHVIDQVLLPSIARGDDNDNSNTNENDNGNTNDNDNGNENGNDNDN
jgi:uncharacterized surface protein with fasciclin (FAS1) repeats